MITRFRSNVTIVFLLKKKTLILFLLWFSGVLDYHGVSDFLQNGVFDACANITNQPIKAPIRCRLHYVSFHLIKTK